MNGYQKIISEATGITAETVLRELEDIMRDTIFHSTLDWQTLAQLKRAAKKAKKIRDLINTPG